MVQKLHICEKVYFDQLFGFSNIALFISSHFIIVSYFTLWILDFFNTIRLSKSLDPDQARHFVGPDLGPNCLQRLSADIAGKELNTKQLVDTFWLKPWLKLISFGSTFSIWLKCRLQQILSQGKPCFVYARALASLRKCADLPEPSLLDNVISTQISWWFLCIM